MTIPYSELTPDQLYSALSERDDQLRVALAEVEKWKESTTAVALASKEFEDSLKTVLKECVEALDNMVGGFSGKELKELSKLPGGNAACEVSCMNVLDAACAITHATTILENTEPPQSK